VFDYQPGRGQQHPQAFLGDYRGLLMSDGYDESVNLADLATEENLDSFLQVLCAANRSGYTINGYFWDLRVVLQRMAPANHSGTSLLPVEYRCGSGCRWRNVRSIHRLSAT
jgi:hypothetical protein